MRGSIQTPKDDFQLWAGQALPNAERWEKVLLMRSRETLEGNIVRLPAWKNKAGIIPAYNRYEGIWNWDAAFHAIGVSRWDVDLAKDQISIIFDEQLPSGALPDVIWGNGKIVSEFGKPPVMPWAIEILDRRNPDNLFFEYYYPKLEALENHSRKERGGDIHGLFNYGGSNPEYESGWDDAVRWDNGCLNLWAIDLNCYMVLLYDSMSHIAGRLKRYDDVEKWRIRKTQLEKAIEERLWSEEHQAYMDFDYIKKEFTGVLTPASFMPMYAGIAQKNRAIIMAKHASDPEGFYPGMPTIAYEDPRYSDNYMRGPCWLHVMAFAVQGLRRYGHTEIADTIRKTVLTWCYDAGYPYEYYDSKTGKPGKGAANRFGWSAVFIIELLLDWTIEKNIRNPV